MGVVRIVEYDPQQGQNPMDRHWGRHSSTKRAHVSATSTSRLTSYCVPVLELVSINCLGDRVGVVRIIDVDPQGGQNSMDRRRRWD